METNENKNQSTVELYTPVINQSLLKFNNLNELKEYAAIMCVSGRCGAKTPEEAIAIYTQANELGIGFASASNHMHIIKGKGGIDYHVMTALLLKAGVEYEIIHNYTPLYKYIDGSGTIFTSDTLPTNYAICSSKLKDQTTEAINNGKHPIYLAVDSKGNAIPDDYVSQVKFTRERLRPFSKTIYSQIIYGTYKWTDILKTGLITKDDGSPDYKSAWYTRPKVMLLKQAFVLGARLIGDDLFMGMLETGELCDVTGTPYSTDDNGNVTILK